MLRYNRKPPTYTLHLASKARKVLKFCLIPHFVIGLLMFSNSAIITPDRHDLGIETFIHLKSRYLNPLRYQNVHSGIFLAALSLFLFLLVFRFTLVCFFRTLYNNCFKRLKSYIIVEHHEDEVTSDNVYSDLPLKHLKREYDKTMKDREEVQKSNKKISIDYTVKLEAKAATIMREFRLRCALGEEWPENEVL